MILYHYTTLRAAEEIITAGQLGFSRVQYFDDPFDTPEALPLHSDPEHIARAEITSHIWQRDAVILSLSRSATSTLMWSHYAEGHRGVVIEVDAYAAGFMDDERNVVPAQFGTVVYSRTRQQKYSPHTAEPGHLRHGHRFESRRYEQLQHLFLTKNLPWAYEEEVRVVKNCHTSTTDPGLRYQNGSGQWQIKKIGASRLLHCCTVPKDSMTKLILGMRADAARVEEWASGVEVCRIPSTLY